MTLIREFGHRSRFHPRIGLVLRLILHIPPQILINAAAMAEFPRPRFRNANSEVFSTNSRRGGRTPTGSPHFRFFGRDNQPMLWKFAGERRPDRGLHPPEISRPSPQKLNQGNRLRLSRAMNSEVTRIHPNSASAHSGRCCQARATSSQLMNGRKN